MDHRRPCGGSSGRVRTGTSQQPVELASAYDAARRDLVREVRRLWLTHRPDPRSRVELRLREQPGAIWDGFTDREPPNLETPGPVLSDARLADLVLNRFNRRLLVLGDKGSGKTTSLVWIMAEPLVQGARSATGATEFALAHAACVVIASGVQIVVFGLMPIMPLDGHQLKQWNRMLWWALYPAAVFFYFHIIINSVHPALGQGSRTTTLYLATGLFVTAWLVSLLLRRIVRTTSIPT
jgi:hypothetical protein